jgi:uncharacterized protein YjbI with pentapeptide repeats
VDIVSSPYYPISTPLVTLLFLYEAKLLMQSNPVIDLRGAHLDGIDLEGAKLPNVNLRGTHLVNANLKDTDMFNSDLSETHSSGADFRNSKLNKVAMFSADLSKADLSNAELEEANLQKANLSHANLETTRLYKANLSYAKLNGAYMGGAILFKANLMRAEFIEATLHSWRRTNLEEANLMGATLVHTVLRGVNLSGADLRGANLLGATLEDAQLNGANLFDIYLDSIGVLRMVESLHDAVLPDGTKHDGRVILSKITSANILQAVSIIDRVGVNRSYDDPMSQYALVYKNKHYPLDDLVLLAFESESDLPHSVFSVSEAKKHIEELGFSVQSLAELIPKN